MALQALEKIQGRTLNAPCLLQTEIASVALKKVLHMTQRCPSSCTASTPPTLFALAWRYNLSAYDASYLWLAAELKAPLTTFDEKLAAAAQIHLASLP